MSEHLAGNVMQFARVLRGAGLAVGTDRVMLALNALETAGLASRRDFRAALAACLIDRREHRALFDEAFDLFWRDPDIAGRLMALALPSVSGLPRPAPPPSTRRLDGLRFPHAPQAPRVTESVDVALESSAQERLRQRDFESMTTEEWTQARAVIQALAPLLAPQPSRRREPGPTGRIDWRATLRAEARGAFQLRRSRPARITPPLVLLTDISGSMGAYARVMLHLAHGAANPASRRHAPRVESFVFATRLSRITPLMRDRDPDAALAAVSQRVIDWDGGTRLTASLREFNRSWARRMLDSRATVLLISDGLEHERADKLAFEARRLRLSCGRLVWLNPLLRFEGFEPRAAGVRALLPEVSLHLPVHNLQSLEQLKMLLCK